MKKYIFSLAVSLLFSCGVALAASESIAVALDRYDQCLSMQHCDAAVSAQVAGKLLQLPGLGADQSPLLRSDMRVASAGFVFKGTVDRIMSASTVPI